MDTTTTPTPAVERKKVERLLKQLRGISREYQVLSDLQNGEAYESGAVVANRAIALVEGLLEAAK